MRKVGTRGSFVNTVVYVLHSWVNESQMRNGCDGQASLFPGRSANVLRFRGTRGARGLWKTLSEDT